MKYGPDCKCGHIARHHGHYGCMFIVGQAYGQYCHCVRYEPTGVRLRDRPREAWEQ